jgi:hypothetical protein
LQLPTVDVAFVVVTGWWVTVVVVAGVWLLLWLACGWRIAGVWLASCWRVADSYSYCCGRRVAGVWLALEGTQV